MLLDAASLVHHGDSMLQGAFAEMIPDVGTLLPVDEFVCEDGQGFCGWIANQRVLFGSREMMANHNIEGLPTKTREAELAEGNGDVLYLSVSGMLAALFSIRITADPHVKRQMQALRQERVALILRSEMCIRDRSRYCSSTLTPVISASNTVWVPSSLVAVTRHSRLTGHSAIRGALTVCAGSGVRWHWANLSTSLPLRTPQKSVAFIMAEVGRLMTNSPDSRIRS